MIPGSNLLLEALSVIQPQYLQYYRFLSRSISSVGQWVSIFDDPITVMGSFQPVDRALYEKYQLDFSKSYFKFYTLNNIISTDRDVTGDQVIFDSKRYQCESNTEWFAVDKWKGVLVVFIENVG